MGWNETRRAGEALVSARSIDRGDIIHLDFSPSFGCEMKGKHFGFVVSTREFNSYGLALVCPISQGSANIARNSGFLVTLMGTGMTTLGSIHCHQIKSLDWKERSVKVIERAPQMIINEVLNRILPLLN